VFFYNINDLLVSKFKFILFNLILHQAYFLIGALNVLCSVLLVLFLHSAEFFKITIKSRFELGQTFSAITSILGVGGTTLADRDF